MICSMSLFSQSPVLKNTGIYYTNNNPNTLSINPETQYGGVTQAAEWAWDAVHRHLYFWNRVSNLWIEYQTSISIDTIITNAMMADMAANTFKGRRTGTGSPEDLSASQVKTILSLNLVENTALSTWTGSTNITTTGIIATGTWNANTIAVNRGGTGLTDVAQGDILYAITNGTLAALNKNVSATRYISNGGSGNNPTWDQVNLANGVTGILPVTRLGGNGVSTNTFLREDGNWVAPGAGLGDVVSDVSVSVVDELVTFSGTDGKTVTRASATGLCLLTAGVLSVIPTPSGTITTNSASQTLTNKTLTSPVINGGTHTAVTSFGIRSSGVGPYDLGLANTENLTAGRVLTIKLNDANRTLDMAGNLTVQSTATIAGTNTGDQTSVSGNAGTATALQTARSIGGVSFDGTSNITVQSATGGFTISGGNLALGANDLRMTGTIGLTGSRVLKGWFTDLQVTNAIVGDITGNAATVTSVTLSNLATQGAHTYVGNSTGSTAVPTAVAAATVRTDIAAYKVYSCLLTQSGTSAPTAAVLENTLGGTVVWTRPTSAGGYTATLTGAFGTAALMAATVYPMNAAAGAYYSYITWGSADNVNLVTKSQSADAQGDYGGMLFVEIRVYPAP